MFESNGRYHGQTQFSGRQHPAMTGNYLPGGVDQNGDIKAEGSHAACDLPDLLPGVHARIAGI
jgi:hypothetical protein